ncbi:MAG TPA: M15 family metallopeptidase [Burkholderiaceae bacterium]|nr:M15 family metallopeptidase [Burkholderiaceae bacterium]
MLVAVVALYFLLAVVVGGWMLFTPRLSWRMRWRAPRPSWRISVALVLVALPSLMAWWWRHEFALDGYSDAVREGNAQITELLRGEQLVAPPALPPEVFATREITLARPALSEADRDWERLDAEFRQRLLWVIKQMRERHGYELVLIEGYRNAERQTHLQAMGSHVTQVGAYQSYHQYGLAADCAFYRHGRLIISEQDPWAARGYALYGDLAEQAGLVWGGRWKMLDLGHVELRRPNGSIPKTQNRAG